MQADIVFWRQNKPFFGLLRCLGKRSDDFSVKLNSKAFPVHTIEAVKDLVDGVIQTKMEETDEGLHYYLRILKVKDARHKTRWQPYEIDLERGLLIYALAACVTKSRQQQLHQL